MRGVNRKRHCKSALEYSSHLRSDATRRQAVPPRRSSFHTNSQNQGRENSFISRQAIGLHFKRKSWQGPRFWQSFSTCTNQRKFYFCNRMQLSTNERQGFFFRTYSRTRTTIWLRKFRDRRRRQRLLHQEESKTPGCQKRSTSRTAETWEGVGRRLSSKDPPIQPTCRNRTIDWSCETRRSAGKKSNEERCCNVSGGLWVYSQFQPSPIHQTQAAEIQQSCIEALKDYQRGNINSR